MEYPRERCILRDSDIISVNVIHIEGNLDKIIQGFHKGYDTVWRIAS